MSAWRRAVAGGLVAIKVVTSKPVARAVDLRARRSYGVDATHPGVLTDPTTRSIVLGLLAEYVAPRSAVTHAFSRLGVTLAPGPER